MNEFPGNMLIYAHVGPDIGTGRLTRCLSLASSWASLGGSVDVVCRRLPGTLRQRVRELGFGLHELASLPEHATTDHRESACFDFVKPGCQPRPAWLVLDGPGFGPVHGTGIGIGADTQVLTIDTSHGNRNGIPAGTVLQQRPFDNLPPASAETETIQGPDFALLNTDDRPGAAGKRQPNRIRRLLGLFCDPDSLSMACGVLAALNQFDSIRLSIDFFVDRGSGKQERFQRLVEDSHHSIRVHRNPDRIPALLSTTHLAICGTDGHFFELAYHGVPAITFANNVGGDSNHRNGLASVSRLLNPEIAPEQLKSQLWAVVRDPQLRQSMSELGQQMIDGKGADRIARRLAVKQLQVRPASERDSDLVYRWRMDPEVRAMCFEPECVSPETHRRWFQTRIQSEQTGFFIVENRDSKRIGHILLDYQPGMDSAELTVSLIPSLRGRGLGTGLIEHACRISESQRPGVAIQAVIKPNNLHAKRAFQKAGFEPVAMTAIAGQVAMQFCNRSPAHTEKSISTSSVSFRRRAS